eukprot:gb/GECH01014293.1/.p1 GENE.gb/GECH01014293.1/~~gb/GECH01014293.1/.p1  ORF type:complete len:322 (+),score=64.62 gb/GECH01014293.1/:1-966(+)
MLRSNYTQNITPHHRTVSRNVSSSSKDVVTIFGGKGFLGSEIVRSIAPKVSQVRIASRRPDLSKFQDYDNVIGVEANITNPNDVMDAIEGSGSVINLVGILHETRNQKMPSLQSDGALHVAQACQEHAVDRLVHISAIGADASSASLYARTKGEGEQHVTRTFPMATILRPSIVFGPNDGFINMFATMSRFSPILPLIGGGFTRFQPVFVGDVAHAVATSLQEPSTRAGTYELGGPDIVTFREIMEMIMQYTGRRRLLLPIPWTVANIQAAIMEMLPHPLLTRDQVLQLQNDNIVSLHAKTLHDLGIEPQSMSQIVPQYIS